MQKADGLRGALDECEEHDTRDEQIARKYMVHNRVIRCERAQNRNHESQHIRAIEPMRFVRQRADLFVVMVGHRKLIKYTIVKINIQMISRKCQKRERSMS